MVLVYEQVGQVVMVTVTERVVFIDVVYLIKMVVKHTTSITD